MDNCIYLTDKSWIKTAIYTTSTIDKHNMYNTFKHYFCITVNRIHYKRVNESSMIVGLVLLRRAH